MGLRQNLSRRELEVAELLTEEKTTSEIAEELKVSEKTVYSHIDSIKGKTGQSSIDDVIEWLSSWFS